MTGGHDGVGLTATNQVHGHQDRRILLLAQGERRVLVHGDDLRGMNDRHVGRHGSAAPPGWPTRRRRGSFDRPGGSAHGPGHPGTTSATPWSPPIASTATRTPSAPVRSDEGCGPVTASARGVVRRGGGLELDGESTVVVAAVGADMMRQLHLVAVRTLLERRQLDGEVRATLTLAGMRDTSLGYTHGVLVAPVVGSSQGRCA